MRSRDPHCRFPADSALSKSVTQIGSGNAEGTTSFWMDNDSVAGGDALNDRVSGDEHFRVTLGGMTLSKEVFNAYPVAR